MHIDKNLLISVAEEMLNMKSTGKEDWCISWLEWFWQQEIEKAICESSKADTKVHRKVGEPPYRAVHPELSK